MLVCVSGEIGLSVMCAARLVSPTKTVGAASSGVLTFVCVSREIGSAVLIQKLRHGSAGDEHGPPDVDGGDPAAGHRDSDRGRALTEQLGSLVDGNRVRAQVRKGTNDGAFASLSRVLLHTTRLPQRG